MSERALRRIDHEVMVKTWSRQPMYENEHCRRAGLIATCNACDRIVWQDEDDKKEFKQSGGYCKECRSTLDPAWMPDKQHRRET